jgi:phage terminase small subunit
MGRTAIHNWEELLKEYLASKYVTKTDFAKAKGINPSLLRRNTTNWPNKGAGETKLKGQKVSKKNQSNVTQKDVTEKGNKKTESGKSNVTSKVTKKVTRKSNQKSIKKAAKKDKSKVKNYLAVVVKNEPEELTEKELLFCFNFVNVHQFNALQSYFKAYDCAYNTARVEGPRLLLKPAIRTEIQRLKKIKYQSIMVQADDLVEKNMRIAFSSITDFADFGQIEVPLISNGKPVMINRPAINMQTGQEEERKVPLTKVVNDVRFKESSEVDGSLIKSIKVGKDGSSIELLDPQKSMDWLEKYFQWNPMDRHKVDFDNKRLKLQEQELALKNKTGSAIQEAIVNAQAQVQTLAGLINQPQKNRDIGEFEKE